MPTPPLDSVGASLGVGPERKSADEVSPPPRRLELLALLVILALACWLRLGWPGIVEFKLDESNLSTLSLDLTHGRSFPLLGIDSSVGIRNSPMSVYIMAIPYLFTTNPEVATSFVGVLNVIGVLLLYLFVKRHYGILAALIAALLFAVNPWAVIFARKIWAQDLLPPFVIATVATGVIGLVEGKRWAQWFHFPLLAITGQIHYGAFVLIPITIWLIGVGARRRTVTWALAGGFVIAALLTVPYIVGLSRAGLLDPGHIRQLFASSPERPASLTWSGDAIHDAALMVSGTDLQIQVGGLESNDYLTSVPAAYPILNGLAWLVLGGTLWLLARAIRRADRRASIDIALALWVVITPLAYSLTWTNVFTHYFIAMLPGTFALLGVIIGDLWCVLETRVSLQRVAALAGGAAILSVIVLQAWLFIALLLFVDSHVTPSGFGTPLHYLLTIRQSILDQHPQRVLARLDGQYIGYNPDTTIWNTLLYDVPSVRFLDSSTEIYPPQPGLYFSHYCVGAVKSYYLRPPGEGCYAISTRTISDFHTTGYTPLIAEPSVRFANGTQLLGYQWHSQLFGNTPVCLSLAWMIDAHSTPNDYHFAVHFTNQNGQEIAFGDDLALRGIYWEVGDIIARTFCLSDSPNNGAITGVQLGMYTLNGSSFHNIDLTDASGQAVGQTVSVKFPTIEKF